MISLIKNLLGITKRKKLLMEALKKGAYIIDVRTPVEYKNGHLQQAVNIPIDQIRNNIDKIKKIGKPVVTCCQTGSRSGRARYLLRKNGIETYNGGGWVLLKDIIKHELTSD